MNVVYDKIKTLIPLRKALKYREDQDFLIVFSEKNVLQYFNEVAKDFYLEVDGERTIEEIVAVLLNEYEVEKKDLENDIFNLVRQLQWNSLLLLKERTQ